MSKTKNFYFKHFNTSHEGSSFKKLRAERDFETMACYWMLLELISFHEHFDSRGQIEIPKSLLHQTWNVNTQRALKIMGKIILNFANTISVEVLSETYKVSCANWLEYQETRGKKNNKKNEKEGTDIRYEILDPKILDNRSIIPSSVDGTETPPPPQDQLFQCKFFKRLTEDTKSKLLSAYPRDFLEREIVSASAYLEANHWRYANREEMFLTSHLSRQWNYLKSKGLQPISEADHLAEIARDVGVKL